MRKAASVSILVALTGCGDACREYSDFSCSELDEASYGVHFYYPNGHEVFVGQVDGLSGCADVASAFADSKGLLDNSEWSYVCCLHAKGSECYEKHR